MRGSQEQQQTTEGIEREKGSRNKKILGQEKVIEFTNSCATQYKGCSGFADISLHQGQLEWHFFETSHGKNVCNGLGALLKNYCYQAVISRKAVLGSAFVYHYATSHLSFTPKLTKNLEVQESWSCLHDNTSTLRQMV